MGEAFRGQFGDAEGLRVFRAPGRVNLIGEHTDYNARLRAAGGARPGHAALPRRRRADGMLRVYSENARRDARIRRRRWSTERERTGHWTRLPDRAWRGSWSRAGFAIEPAEPADPQHGAGGLGPEFVGGAGGVLGAGAAARPARWRRSTLARLCQRAEADFVGMPCGIMDQYVSVFGREHAAVQIDCRSLEHRTCRCRMASSFVAVNTMVKHALGASAYRERVQECAARWMESAGAIPAVASLRDVTLAQFEAIASDAAGGGGAAGAARGHRKRARGALRRGQRARRPAALWDGCWWSRTAACSTTTR